MIRPTFSIRGILFVVVIIALALGIVTTNSKTANVDARIEFIRRVQTEAWQHRNWRPDPDDQSVQFGPRYGITPGTLWRDQDAWYEREYWIHVPADGTYQLELVLFDWRDGINGSATKHFFADLPHGTGLLRWDLRDCSVNKDIVIWVNDRPMIDLAVPITEGMQLAMDYQYADPDKDDVHRSHGPSKTRLRVAAACAKNPRPNPIDSFVMRHLFEIRLCPKTVQLKTETRVSQ